MFYPAKMKKIEVLALDKYQKEIVEKLHGLGTVEITENEEGGREDRKGRKRRELILSQLRKTEALLNFLSGYETLARVTLKRFIFEGPPIFSFDSDLLSDGPAMSYLSGLERKVKNKRDMLTRLEAEIEKRAGTMETIKRLEGFNVDLSEIRDTKAVFSLAGEIATENLEALAEELRPYPVSVSIQRNRAVAILILLGLKREKDMVVGALLRQGFTRIIIPDVRGRPRDLLPKYADRIAGLKEERKKISEDLTALAKREVNNLLALQEFFDIKRARVEVTRRFSHSQRTFTLKGYIPERLVEKTTDEIVDISEGHAFVKVLEPEVDERAIPVMFDNPEPIKAFQVLTRAYAMPRYGEVDPTLLMALWFPFFFGIMLTDAAYGIGVLLLSLFILRKFESPGIRDIGKILMLSALWTVVLGAAFGSVFGNFFEQFFDIHLGVFDPLERADLGLLIAIILGVLHLNLGLFIGVKRKLQKGDVKALVFEHLWIILIEVSVGLFLLNWSTGYAPFKWAGALLILGAVLILLSKASVFGVLEIQTLLGANLSYARLLALALATTGIALAVNIIGELLLGSIVGSVLGILVLFGGHMFNFGINVFGAFVHSMRLHYVEFFSMFYEGGGREFSPFKAKRKYTNKGGV